MLSGLLAAFIVGGILPRFADLSEASRLLERLEPTWLVMLALLTAGTMVAAWVALARLIGEVTVGQAATAHLLSTAVANTVPAGGVVAVGVNLRVYASFGRGPGATTRGLLAMGVIDNAVKLLLPVAVAVLGPLLPGRASLPPAVVPSAGVAAAGLVVVVTVLLRNERMLGRVGAWFESAVARWRTGDDRPRDWGGALLRYQRALRALIAGSGRVAVIAVVATHVLQAVLLLVALRALGVSETDLAVEEVVIAYAVMRVITALPVTPGGLGVAEVGLIGTLDLAAGDGVDTEIGAAVLLFRALTYLLPVVLAAPTWIAWRVRHHG